jgi:transcriptional regulator with XRE-family HTH domain
MDEIKNIRTRFGVRVRKCRLETGLSQEELANRAGLHRTYIGGIERGERNVSLINIVRIARAMNLKPEHLMLGIADE